MLCSTDEGAPLTSAVAGNSIQLMSPETENPSSEAQNAQVLGEASITPRPPSVHL